MGTFIQIIVILALLAAFTFAGYKVGETANTKKGGSSGGDSDSKGRSGREEQLG